MPRSILLVISLLALLATPVAAQEATPEATPVAAEADAITVVASGLTNPRGLLVIADVSLYVVEAGSGGTNPPTDINGDADYRRHLAPVLARRAVLGAAG